MSFRIKPKKPNFKKLKKELRKLIMNNNHLQAVPSNQPQAPKELTDKEQYQNITGALGQFIQQFSFPSGQLVAPRMEKFFDDMRRFLENRLVEEIKAGYQE